MGKFYTKRQTETKEKPVSDQPPNSSTESVDTLNSEGIECYDAKEYERAVLIFEQVLLLKKEIYGETHPRVASGLHNLALSYEAQGRYNEAEPLLKQELEIYRNELDEAHPHIAMSLNSLAELYFLQGHYSGAEPFYKQALEIRRNAFGEDNQDVATSLNNLAILYKSQGRYSEAEPLLQQALSIWRNLLGEDHPFVATGLNNLAELYCIHGDYAEAERLFGEATGIYRKTYGDEDLEVASSLNNLAFLYQAQGRYTEAEPLYKQAFNIYRKGLGEDHPNIATVLNNLAHLYQVQGRYIEAEWPLQKALSIYKSSMEEDHPNIAIVLNNLAQLYQAQGRYAKAETLLQQTLNIHRKALGEVHPDLATSLNNLGFLYYVQKRYADAEPLLQEALQIRSNALGEDHPEVATGFNNLAQLYCSQGRYAEAEPLFQYALQIWRSAQVETHPRIAGVLANLGLMYHERDLDTQAELFLQEAHSIWRSTLGTDHPDVAISLNNLAGLLGATEQPLKALSSMQEAHTIEQKLLLQVFASASEQQRFQFLRTISGNIDAFLSLIMFQLFDHLPAPKIVLDTLLQRKAIVAEASAVVRDTILGGGYPQFRDGFTQLNILRQQNATFAQTLFQHDLLPSQRQKIARMLAEGEQEREELEAFLASQVPERALRTRVQNADRQAVAAALPPKSVFVEFIRFQRFNFQSHAEKLPQNSNGPEGADRWQPAQPWQEWRYMALALPAGQPEAVQMIDMGPAEEIEKQMRTFLVFLSDYETAEKTMIQVNGQNRSDIQFRQTGLPLYTLLWAPLMASVRNCKEVFLAPDGALLELPFGLLPLPEGGLLQEQHSLRYLTVGRDVLLLGHRLNDHSTDPPLVLADPNYDLMHPDEPSPLMSTLNGNSPEDSEEHGGRLSRDILAGHTTLYARMPGTRLEASLLQEMLGAKVLQGEDALENHILNVRAPRILHLATHGEILPDLEPSSDERSMGSTLIGQDTLSPRLENPLLRSWLALAGANTFLRGGKLPQEAGDGLLTAEEVSGMNLLGTEMVVLSACKTGLGTIHSGEGVMGLRRAFLQAGARTVVVSLWSVDDVATAILMGRFYQNLLGSREGTVPMLRDLALSKAQEYVREVRAAQLGSEWLTEERIVAMAEGSRKQERHLRSHVSGARGEHPFRHPYYWAGFILIGENEPLAAQ